MKLSNKGLELIKSFEGFRSHPYQDSVGVWTIGYGTTHYPDGKKVGPNDNSISESRASDIMKAMIDKEYVPQVIESIGNTPTSQEQFDALVSFAYNLGAGALDRSTLIKLHRQRNYGLAAAEFPRWNKAGGKTLAGLTRRREEERKLYELIV